MNRQPRRQSTKNSELAALKRLLRKHGVSGELRIGNDPPIILNKTKKEPPEGGS